MIASTSEHTEKQQPQVSRNLLWGAADKGGSIARWFSRARDQGDVTTIVNNILMPFCLVVSSTCVKMRVLVFFS